MFIIGCVEPERNIKMMDKKSKSMRQDDEAGMEMSERMRRRGPFGMIAMMIKRMMGGGEDETATDETPLEALKRRFANGEITKEEFLEMKELLSD